MSISITVHVDSDVIHLETYPHEYRSLMALLYDKVIYSDEFGDCRGMGRCGTCLVQFLSLETEFSTYDRNEEATLEKMNIDKASVHLSCQILIDQGLNGAVINIMR